jgi:hypothetical protein
VCSERSSCIQPAIGDPALLLQFLGLAAPVGDLARVAGAYEERERRDRVTHDGRPDAGRRDRRPTGGNAYPQRQEEHVRVPPRSAEPREQDVDDRLKQHGIPSRDSDSHQSPEQDASEREFVDHGGGDRIDPGAGIGARGRQPQLAIAVPGESAHLEHTDPREKHPESENVLAVAGDQVEVVVGIRVDYVDGGKEPEAQHVPGEPSEQARSIGVLRLVVFGRAESLRLEPEEEEEHEDAAGDNDADRL